MNNVPHTAIIQVIVTAYQKLPTGEIGTTILSEDELKEYGIRKKTLIGIDGFDKFECMKKVKMKIDKLKETSND